MSKNDGGSAFPTNDEQMAYLENRGLVGVRGYGGELGEKGMSLRDQLTIWLEEA